jgi:hypothetical protein
MKKTSGFLFVCLILLVVLVGCNDSKGDNNEDTDTGASNSGGDSEAESDEGDDGGDDSDDSGSDNDDGTDSVDLSDFETDIDCLEENCPDEWQACMDNDDCMGLIECALACPEDDTQAMCTAQCAISYSGGVEVGIALQVCAADVCELPFV